MANHLPFDLYALDLYGLSHHSLARFKQIVQRDHAIPADVVMHIEDTLIPALEWLENWEPCDADVQEHIESRGVF